MRFDDLNWMDIESYLQQNDRIIVVIGSTEQHGYLSLTTDNQIPMFIADAVAQRTHTLIAPPLNFGCTDYFMEYPGTITLQEATFTAVITDILKSLIQHGFKRILVLNGHGGNKPPETLDALPASIVWHNWWQSAVVENFAADLQLERGHANWMENFPFTRVTDSPQERKAPVNLTYSESNIRSLLGDGSAGDLYEIADQHMQRLFGLVVDEVTSILVNLPEA